MIVPMQKLQHAIMKEHYRGLFLGVPYDKYSYRRPPNPILIIKASILIHIFCQRGALNPKPVAPYALNPQKSKSEALTRIPESRGGGAGAYQASCL